MENYFSWRLKGEGEAAPPLTEEEEKIAKHFYHEIMIRYIVNYSHFSHEDLYRTGFSNLLAFPEFNDPLALANGLSLFENPQKLSSLLKDSATQEGISFWIGKDLTSYAPSASHCAVIAMPYRINQVTVGAIGLLGPTRMPYRHLFGILQVFSAYISESLTRSLYKFKLQYRQAKPGDTYLDKEDRLLIHQSHPYLLENKS
jgi:heat-inducible transcriptional repressor